MKKWYLSTRCCDMVAVKVGFIFCICLLALTFLTFITGCGETVSDNRTDRQKAGLRGEVKICKLYNIRFDEMFGRYTCWSDTSDDWGIIESLEFLESGNISKATYYKWGFVLYKEEFTYDNDGKITECIILEVVPTSADNYLPKYGNRYSYKKGTSKIDEIKGYEYNGDDEDNSFSWIHIYDYPEDNKVRISSYGDWGQLNWRHIQKYDASGMRVESVHYDESGLIQWSEKFSYDSKGNRTEWARYDSNGSIEWVNKYWYDDNGNEVECEEKDSQSEETHRYFYRYISVNALEESDVGWANYKEVIKNGLNPEEIIKNDKKFGINENWTVKITLEEIKGLEDTRFEITNIEKRVIEYY